MVSKMRKIDEWFDPHNIEHLRAYSELELTGRWPVGFIPSDVELRPAWHIILLSKMADCWLEEQLKKV